MSTTAQHCIAIEVSREGLVSSLRHQFTSRDTFVGELLQNARRAGATRVEIAYDPDTRRFIAEDDGQGIEDPQVLLTLGQSGWDNLELMARENPFGVGFASAIFSAEHIRVESQDWHIDTSTENLLGMGLVTVESSATPRTGTRVALTLHDNKGDAQGERLLKGIADKAEGFPLPVYLNGERLSQPDVLDETFYDCGVGKIRMPLGAGLLPRNVQLYIQGLPVRAPDWGCWWYRMQSTPNPVVIHLDERQFSARMPDRDTLIDADEAFKAIRKEMTAIWAAYLADEKRRLGREAFAKELFHECRWAGVDDLLDDCPLPPGQWGWFVDMPRNARYHGEDENAIEFSRAGDPALYPGDGPLVEWLTGEDVEANTAAATFATAAGLRVAMTVNLNHQHWAIKEALRLTDIDCPITDIEGALEPVSFTGGRMIFFDKIVFCERYTIRPDHPDLAPVTVDDLPTYDAAQDTAYIPRQATRSHLEEFLLQRHDYEPDFGEVQEDDLEADADNLWQLMRLTLNGSKSEVVKELIEPALDAMGASLHDEAFTVRIGADGQVAVEPA